MATKTRQLADFLVEGGLSDVRSPEKPHIDPGTLQPAVAGKLLDGTTDHGSTYGVAQSDGHSYYYTDIKGSKPIKDPRIGAHFGSQRHTFNSLQLLEQETATHGKQVHSVDGREWIRAVDGNQKWTVVNDVGQGNLITNNHDSSNSFIEIVAYCNNINLIGYTATNAADDIDVYVNGTLSGDLTGKTGTRTAVGSPLLDRAVDPASVVNLGSLGTTPNIKTIKLLITNGSSEYAYWYGIELIAQDTTSTANKSKVQIPSQNVVSYGKKFTVSGTPHYDPFNGFTNGTTLHSAVVDTATSLGLSTAPGSSASWAISSTNNIRPYNGGRVVKWVASDGTIKTSVNMMPPNAQNILGTVAGTTEVTTPSATNATYTPIFSDDAVDHSLSEVAKTYHWREFGNGSANGGTGHANYADFSMHINNDSTEDNMGYVMDDGLTCCTGLGSHTTSENITSGGDAKGFHFTFIGTGITLKTTSGGAGTRTMALNLPYGTHIYKHFRDAGATPDGTIDGVALADIAGNTYSGWDEVSFHQPKMPPIPEDACILADYMLMADYVGQTTASPAHISKGVRRVSCSRDVFYNSGASLTLEVNSVDNSAQGTVIYNTNASSVGKLPFFGTNSIEMGFLQSGNERFASQFNGSASANQVKVYDSSKWAGVIKHDGATLGVNTAQNAYNGSSHYYASDFQLISPVHSSSHYQSFETPYLHELVGGDRNMEQNNLIVTPDGKSWDEVTRDTSYIGGLVVSTTTDTASTAGGTTQLFDEWRGASAGIKFHFNKDFAIAYDRMICLRSGQYTIKSQTRANTANQETCRIVVNGTVVKTSKPYADLVGSVTNSATVSLNRGDYVQSQGAWFADKQYTNFEIIRVN